MRKKAAIIRCDGSPSIGLGHVMRCLALAQAMKKTFRPVFASRYIPASMRTRLAREGFKVLRMSSAPGSAADAHEVAGIARREGAGWIITDGYRFGAAYQSRIKSRGYRLMCIDDIAGCEYAADIVLNQNPGFSARDYRAPKGTKFLLGPRYALLREEFRRLRPAGKRFGPAGARTVLVTMGGADSVNMTGRVIEALKGFEGIKTTVLVGSANPNLSRIADIRRGSEQLVKVVVDANNVAPYLRGADIAIHAAGGTSWELAYMGVPGICYVLADNQAPVAKELAGAGISRSMGWHADFSKEKLRMKFRELITSPRLLRRMSKAGRATIDGRGAERAAKELTREDD